MSGQLATSMVTVLSTATDDAPLVLARWLADHHAEIFDYLSAADAAELDRLLDAAIPGWADE